MIILLKHMISIDIQTNMDITSVTGNLADVHLDLSTQLEGQGLDQTSHLVMAGIPHRQLAFISVMIQNRPFYL